MEEGSAAGMANRHRTTHYLQEAKAALAEPVTGSPPLSFLLLGLTRSRAGIASGPGGEWKEPRL
jgi:hypothetical protein